VTAPIHVSVNGEPRELAAGTTVAELLRVLSIREGRVAVEVNLDVVRREQRESRVLADGDRIEIVSFVGGGR
jgi:thiamine biosynthesis protein ThiS